MNHHRNSRLWRIAIVALILVILPLAVTACDGYFAVTGTVYEWVDAPEGNNGEIYADTAAPEGRVITPLAGASLEFSHSNHTVTTSDNGSFKDSTVVSWRESKTEVKIEKEGYHTIEGEIRYGDDINHSLVVFLVRQ
jgi:hypothetical protein